VNLLGLVNHGWRRLGRFASAAVRFGSSIGAFRQSTHVETGFVIVVGSFPNTHDETGEKDNRQSVPRHRIALSNSTTLAHSSKRPTYGKPVLASVLILALLASACTSSQIVTTLDAVVSAAEIAIPIIGTAAGLPPAISNLIVTYLAEVSTATGQAATILAGPGTSAQKTAQIIAAFAQVASGLTLPPGTPAQVVTVVNAVVQAVLQFLSNFPVSPAMVAAPVIKLNASDVKKLAGLKTRSDANLAKLQGMKR
jgi:hypothetical protein